MYCKNAGFPEPALAANVRFPDSIVWKGRHQEKNCVFSCYLWKMKEKPANKNGGLCFSMKSKATCKNE